VIHDAMVVPVNGDNVLVRSGWTEAEVWSLASRTRLGKRAGAALRACLLPMGDDEPVVVSVTTDFRIEAWNLRTQVPMCPPMVGHTDYVNTLRPGTIGGVAVVASASSDGTVRLWDPKTGGQMGDSLGDHIMGAYGLEIASWNARDVVITGAGNGRLRCWDALCSEDIGVDLEPFPSVVRAIRATVVNGSPTLIAVDRYGLIRVWDMNTSSWTTELDIGSGINGIAIDRGGQVCVATDMGVIALRLNLTTHRGGS
jgi:WD40 repeat protein